MTDVFAYLGDDLISIIISFLDCIHKTSFYCLNTKLEKVYSRFNQCQLRGFKDLVICQTHSCDQTLENVIIQLQKAQLQQDSGGLVYSIHFRNTREINIANPYLKDFGIISHRCCQGTKIVFRVPESWIDKQGRLHVHQ